MAQRKEPDTNEGADTACRTVVLRRREQQEDVVSPWFVPDTHQELLWSVIDRDEHKTEAQQKYCGSQKQQCSADPLRSKYEIQSLGYLVPHLIVHASAADLSDGMRDVNLILMPFNVREEALINALVVRVVA